MTSETAPPTAPTLSAEDRNALERIEDSGDVQGLAWRVEQMLAHYATTPPAPDVDALLAEDDAFGDANGAIRTALIGRAAAMDAAGRVVTIERCYASGLAQAAIRALRDLREAQSTGGAS